MKRRITLLAAALALLAARPLTTGMDLTLEPGRRNYLLGEPVRVRVQARNATREPVTTSVVLTPEAGFVQFFVSEDGKEFKQYLGPGWGTRDIFLSPQEVEPGAKYEAEVELLWHHVIPGDEQFLRRPLAFTEERCYWVKATALLPAFERESNTIEICTVAPKGPDLAVWKRFLAEPELARFVQRPNGDLRDEIRQRAEALLAQYPSTAYTPYLERALRERRGFDAQHPR